MRFQTYINENTDYDALESYIKNNCRPFLKEFVKAYFEKKFIYRGANKFSTDFIVKKTRKERKPRFVGKEAHKYLSTISKEIFGWDIRSTGVFVGSRLTSQGYGQPAIFMASGKYRYVYVKDTEDIYNFYDKLKFTYEASAQWKEERKDKYWKENPEEREEEDKEDIFTINLWKDKIRNIYKNDYKRKNLPLTSLHLNPYEAVFKCDEYILINYNTITLPFIKNIISTL